MAHERQERRSGLNMHPGGEETPGREPAKPVDQSGGEEREGNEERGEGKKDDKLLVPIRAERQSQSGQTQPAPTHAKEVWINKQINDKRKEKSPPSSRDQNAAELQVPSCDSNAFFFFNLNIMFKGL